MPMKKLLLSTVVAALATSAANAGQPFASDENEERMFECSVIKVSPPDNDRDPGYKITVSLDGNGFTSVVHTTRSGRTWDRSEQYSHRRSWNDAKNGGDGPYVWTGWSAKYQVTMKGVIGGQSGKLVYDEYVYQGNKLVTKVQSVCHQIGI